MLQKLFGSNESLTSQYKIGYRCAMLSDSDASDFQSQLSQRLVTNFQPLGITPRIKIKGDLMQVLVEAAQVPDATTVIPVVQRELEVLQPDFLKMIQVYGRKTGEKVPSWTEPIAWLSAAEKLSTQAKQGNPEAIATLINQAIAPHSVTAEVQVSGETVQILLEADIVPEQPVMTELIQRQLHHLTGGLLHQIILYGKQTQDDFLDWQTTLEINPPPPPQSLPPDPPQASTHPHQADNPKPLTGTGQSFVGQDLRGKKLAGMDLADANFQAMNLTGACFEGANLTRANFGDAEISRVNFDKACLTESNFQRAHVASTTKLLDKRQQFLSPSGIVGYLLLLGLVLLLTKAMVLLTVGLTAGLTFGLMKLRKSGKNHEITLARAIRTFIIVVACVYFGSLLWPLIRLGSLRPSYFNFSIAALINFPILFLLTHQLITAMKQELPGRIGGWAGALAAWLVCSLSSVMRLGILLGLGSFGPFSINVFYGVNLFHILGLLLVFSMLTLLHVALGVVTGKAIAELLLGQERLSFRHANLHNVDFSDASLINADFTKAELQGTVFHNTSITGAILPDGQVFYPGINLQNYTEI